MSERAAKRARHVGPAAVELSRRQGRQAIIKAAKQEASEAEQDAASHQGDAAQARARQPGLLAAADDAYDAALARAQATRKDAKERGAAALSRGADGAR